MDNTSASQNRIESLDWLRGLMAASIMFYHLFSGLFFQLKADSVLGRLGIYAVSIFFILSGLSMAIVYNNYITNLTTAFFFFIRRLFRIWPLLWVATFLMIPYLMKIGTFSLNLLILNLTTLFGFIKPEAYMVTGAWSIGNEIVYYALTPLIIWLYNRKLIFGNLFLVLTIIIGMVFSFFILSPNKSLAEQWSIYINPFNNLFLYTIGIAIYFNLKDYSINSYRNNMLLLLAISVFILSPYTGDQISIVTGFGRIVFSLLSIIIVFTFYKIKIVLPRFIEISLTSFGMATYSIYLLHPIILSYMCSLLDRLNIALDPVSKFVAVTAITIVVSLISFTFFEKKIIRLGKELTSLDEDKKYAKA